MRKLINTQFILDLISRITLSAADRKKPNLIRIKPLPKNIHYNKLFLPSDNNIPFAEFKMNYLGINKSILVLWMLVFSLIVHNGMAQNNFKSQDDLKKSAERAFAAKDYVKATPLYSQLLSTVPKDAMYNFKYGVCILYTNNDKSKCLKYLQIAAKNPKTTNDVYYYLGKAYHLNQWYDDAINAFTMFKKNASSNDVQKKGVEAELQSINNAKNHLGGNLNQVIVSKNQIPFSSFTTAYDVSAMGGKILDKPPIYKMKGDKNDNTNTVIYLNNDLKTIYFSSYGIDAKNGKDIYKVIKNKKGEWSEPISLGTPINTASDEDYPFISSDGKTLYFSSKGHNSIGGYDVFKSVYDSLKGSWSQPVNMGTPVNSAFDDLFYVVDTMGNANFSSMRESMIGNIGFYKMIISERPLDYTTINGTLTTDILSDSKEATISILNYNDGSVADVIKTDSSTGKYVLKVKPGKGYTLVVEKKEYLPHAENIYVPEQAVEHDLGQQLQLSNNDSVEKLNISNYFSILEDNNDPNSTVKTEEIASKFKHDDNYKEKLKPVTINGNSINVTPPVNDISAQAKTLTASMFTPSNAVVNDSKDTVSTTSKANVASGTSSIETPAKKDEIKTEISKPEKENIITSKTTNNQLVSIAYNDATATQNEAREMKKNAAIADNIGRQRDSIADKLDKEIVTLTKKMEVEKSPAMKQNLKDSIRLKRDETSEKREEAKVAYTLSNEYKNDGDKFQKDADESFATAKALETSAEGTKETNKQVVAKKNADKSSSVSIGKKVTGTSSNDLVLKAATNYSEQSKEKQKAADSVTMAANMLKQESAYLTNKANDTINKAIKTPEPEKTRLRKKAAEMERQSAQKQIEADQAVAHSKQLKDSALIEQKKAEIAKTFANIILNKNADTTTATIAPITSDKTVNKNEDKRVDETKDLAAINKTDSISHADSLFKINEKITKENLKDVAAIANEKKADTSSISATSNKKKDRDLNPPSIDSAKSNDIKKNKDIAKTTVIPIDSKSKDENDSKVAASGDSTAAIAKADSLNFQAKRLNYQSQQLFAKAKVTKNQKEKLKIMKQAESLSDSSVEKQKQADVASAYVEELRKREVVNEVVKSEPQKDSKVKDIIVKNQATTAAKEVNNTNKETQVERNENSEPKKNEIINQPKVNSDSLAAINESKVKQKEVIKSSMPNKEKDINIPASNNSKQSESIAAQAVQLDIVADSLSNQSKDLYAKAKTIEDKSERRNINMQAYNLQTESVNKHQQAVEKRNEIEQLNSGNKTSDVAVIKPIDNSIDKSPKSNATDTKINSNQSLHSSTKGDIIATKSDKKEEANNTRIYDQKFDTISNKTTAITPSITSIDSVFDKNNPEYPRYIQLVASAKEKRKVTEAEFAKAVELENQAKDDQKQAKDKFDEANKTKKKKQKAELNKMAKNLQHDAEIKQHDADSIYVVAKDLARVSDNQKAEAIMLKEKLTTTVVANKSDLPNKDTLKIINDKLKEEKANTSSNKYVFNISKEKTVNNEIKPIPHNEKLPDGLYFKVQIGAFRAPVSGDAFRGLQPVTYEDGPNGWLRYTAGLFQTFESANLAKKEIRAMGYRDAFVVAYRDGKRISIYDAGLLIHALTSPQQQTYQFVYVEETKVLKANNIYPEKYAPEANDINLYTFRNAVKTSPVAAIKTPIDVPNNASNTAVQNNNTPTNTSSFNIKNNEGLFYTVQVGVYGNATPPGILESLKPLNTEVTAKGYYRFLSGLYNYFPPADAAKNNIARTLVPDAFVVAYYKGSRINLNQARELEKTVIPMKFTTPIPPTKTPEPAPVKANPIVIIKDTTPVQPPKQPEFKATEETIDAATISFKVQLGAYREQVPFEVVDLFLKLSNKGISHTKDADGLTYYFAGSVRDYDTAVQLRNMVVNAGIKDAFVVAFSGDKKITIEQAKKNLK